MGTCKNCANRYRDQMGISYCKKQKGDNTYNGYKRIKASSMACILYNKKQ